MNDRLTIFGEADENTRKQMDNCLAVEDHAIGVLCADNHLGYGQPVGGAVAYEQHISVAGVGYDIGCGNKAVRTDLMVADVEGDIAPIMDEIFSEISFGVGMKNGVKVDHPVLEAIEQAHFEGQREMAETARKQLGTVGGGNHYVDLFADDDGFLWVGVHFGSRGFGWNTCEGFRAMSHGLPFSRKEREDKGLKVPGEDSLAPPLVFDIASPMGQAYIEAMNLAGAYAFAGRDVVVDKVVELLGTRITREVHNHHNFAWKEEHFGKMWWVCRKGCTPAFPGQEGFVGASMAEDAVILEGREGFTSKMALYSTVHGAGRAMSRTKAAGKMKTVRECSARDCNFRATPGEYRVAREKAGVAQHERFSMCPEHPDGKMKKRRGRIEPGVIDWPAALKELEARGIVLRGGDAEEAPLAYKRLTEVLAYQGSTIEVTGNLRLLGVAMAPSETPDPYKD